MPLPEFEMQYSRLIIIPTYHVNTLLVQTRRILQALLRAFLELDFLLPRFNSADL
jgi:hypothetical protein